MRRFLEVVTSVALILLVGQTLFLAPPILRAAPPPSPVSSLDVSKIANIGAMRTRLDALYTESLQAKENGRFTLELQELILKKSGDATSRILELEKHADLASRSVSREFREALEKNEAILQFINKSNEEVIEELQEEKLDKVEDIDAFLDSPEWRMPERMISLSRFGLSWSRYYRSLLLPEGSPERKKLLDESIAGFSLTLLDIEDKAVVAKSLFGRALCFKETANYEKAAEDLKSITTHVRHNNPLYIWSLYELASLHYRAGEMREALLLLDKLDAEVEEKTIKEVLGTEHKRLRERVVLEPRANALLDKIRKERETKGEAAEVSCHEALQVLKRLSRNNPTYATKLYRLVAENAALFTEFSYDDLGEIGCLALADDFFKKEEYGQAAKRYRHLWAASDVTIRNRMDDVYFRSGYAACQIGRWKDALSGFDRLDKEFPRSNLGGKAACLEYVAAAGEYSQASTPRHYARYIESAKKYLKKCPDPRDRNGAHFLLGNDYEKKGKKRAARGEFTAIEEGSSTYWPARYYLLQSDVEELERLKSAGKGGAVTAKRLYRKAASQFEKFQRLPGKEKGRPAIAEILPYMTILQARLYRCGIGDACGKAIRTLDGFEKRFPREQPLWLTAVELRLKCYRDKQMIDQAKAQIEFLFREVPVDENLWRFLAEWARMYDEEAGRWRNGGNPDLGDAYTDLALTVYTGMAGIASEHASYQKNLAGIQFRMADILTARGEWERAGRLYNKILERTPESADALSRLGAIYETQGKWTEALEVWRKYSKGVEAGSYAWLDARYRIAVAHSKMGREQEACEVITMLRVLHPDVGDKELQQKILALEKAVCGKGNQASGR